MWNACSKCSIAKTVALAIAVELEQPSRLPTAEEEMTKSDAAGQPCSALTVRRGLASQRRNLTARRIAISVCRRIRQHGQTRFRCSRELSFALILDPTALPKSIHDYKAAIHALDSPGINLQGVQHDPMLYSYLLDPTYSSHRLPDVALRRFNLKLSGDLAEAADITGRLAIAFARKSNSRPHQAVRRNRSCRSVPVLARMEQAGVKIDTAALCENVVSSSSARSTQSERNLRDRGLRIQHRFSQATGRRALQQAESAEAGEVRQRTHHFDRGRCARSPRRRLSHRAAWCSNTASSPS